jgi:hypothetical protein
MSRNISTGSGRKLQISSPQPYTPPTRQFDGPLPPALQPVQVPQGLNLRRPSGNHADGGGSSPGNGKGGGAAGRFEAAIPPPGVAVDGTSGEFSLSSSGHGGARRIPSGSSATGTTTTTSAPLRPARSIRRAPGTDTSVRTVSGGAGRQHDREERTLQVPPGDSRGGDVRNRIPTPPPQHVHSPSVPTSFVQPVAQHVQTQQTATLHPSNSYSQFPPPPTTTHNTNDQPLSPSMDEPPTPIGHQPPSSGKIWEQERAQRSQLLQNVGRGTTEREQKLLGVVNAFAGGKSSSGTGSSSKSASGTATPRDGQRNGKSGITSAIELQDQDLLIGNGGRGFDDVDGTS